MGWATAPYLRGNMSAFKAYNAVDFKCKRCLRNEIDHAIVSMCNKIFEITGRYYKINSGYRCSVHNKAVGGSNTSSHLKGWAVDLETENSVTRFLLLKALFQLNITRIGIYPTFIHIDIDKTKDQGVTWFKG